MSTLPNAVIGAALLRSAFAVLSLCLACSPGPAPVSPDGESNAPVAEAPAGSEEPAQEEAVDVGGAAPGGDGAGNENAGATAPPGRAASTPASAGIDLDAADDGLDADIAQLSASTRDEKAKPAAEQAGREIVYRVTAKGLVIEVDGIHLRPEAKPFKDKNGAYGVELVVNAESFDGRQYWVNQPREGPLSIAGKVESKGGKSSRFADQRDGSGEQAVTAAEPRRFKQRWPGHGQPKLWWGQTVTLEIGLWGVRADGGRERPVRRLFVVKMLAGNQPQAVISPPAMDWGS